MPLRPERLVVVSAIRLLRSPRIHGVALGGALFLARLSGIGEGGWLFPAVYSGLAVAITLYTIAARSRGFLEYASSSLPCPLMAALLALGAGIASAVVSIPVSLILGATPEPLTIAAALMLGASYTLTVLPLGTSIPILIALYLALKLGNGPQTLVTASLLLGMAMTPLACLTGPGGLDIRVRMQRRP